MRAAQATEDKKIVKVEQYITDKRGRNVGAIIDLKELARIQELLEDLYDLKTIERRAEEPKENYEAYSRKRKSCRV